jgi:hypothetical protein
VGRGGFRIEETGVSSFLERVWQKRVDMGSDWHCRQVPERRKSARVAKSGVVGTWDAGTATVSACYCPW